MSEGLRSTPTFPDGIHCSHGYPPGEYCPACGEIPDPDAGMVPDDEDDSVLGCCPHGVDLDREFCPKGCRV